MFKELTYEEAYFHKVLIELGFNEEFEKYIDYLENELIVYEGFYLDLIYNQSSPLNVISLLNNFILDKDIDKSLVFEKVRLFLLDKLNNNEINEKKAIELLSLLYNHYFTYIDKMEEWFYFYEEYIMGYLKDENINVAIRTFLEKGEIEYDTYNLLYEENKKEYLKVGLYVFIYISLIVILGALTAFIINSINSELVKISLPFVIMIMAFLIVPVIVIYSIDWTLLKGIITKNKDRKG